MRTLVLGTAGHIDHGKSALVEALTGAHPDRLKEEQTRGITIALGFAHARIGDVSVAFVDVPGHERFVRTMVAGAGGLDAVLLVVAAGESVMPQTREHFEICRLLGITRGVLVLTKCDLVDAETRALAELDVRELVAGSALATAPVIAVSARTGEGMEALRNAIEALAANAPAPRPGCGVRVPVDRVFSVKGFGTVVTGTLVSGRLEVDDVVTLLPDGRTARVRGVQVHGESTVYAEAPRRVALNLGGIDLQDVYRGMTVSTPDALPVTRRVDVVIQALPAAVLRHGGTVRVHHGTSESSARVLISAVRSAGDESWQPVTPGEVDIRVPPGGRALARLRLAGAMVLTRGDRLVLRLPSPARTIGGAQVLDPQPPRGGVRREGGADRLVHLDTDPLEDVCLRWVAEARLSGTTVDALARRSGMSRAMVTGVVQNLVDATRVVRCGHATFVDGQQVTAAAAAVAGCLKAYHADYPDDEGMPREQLRAVAADAADDATFEVILQLAGVQSIARNERLALRTHRPTVNDEDSRVRAVVLSTLLASGLQPPDVATLATAAGATTAAVQQALLALVKQRQVIKLADLWFHTEVLTSLKARVRELGSGASIDVSEAKARFGVSRKFAIPLLEFLDRERVTRRIGNSRRVL